MYKQDNFLNKIFVKNAIEFFRMPNEYQELVLHQLRQHVLHLTNKIGGLIGDTKYFGKNKNDQLSSSLGLMLHAYELCIPARTLGNHQVRDLIIREELPTRMQKIFRKYNIPSRILATALEE